MIWVRRAIAVLAGLLLLPVLFALLALQGAYWTLLSPGFHASELRKAGVYEFALGDLLTTALDEAREIETGPLTVSIDGQDRTLLDGNPLAALGLSSEDIAESVRRAAPPDWVRGVVEEWLDQVGGYMTGERDDFEVGIRLDEQARALIEELKLLLRKADAGGLLFEALVEPEMERAAASVPFGLDVSAERLTESARRIVGPDWIQEQVDAALDEAAPYLVGERDEFEIRVDLAGRAEAALEEVKALLREADAYEVLFEQLVEPEMERAAASVPFDLDVSAERLTESARRVVGPDWIQDQVEAALDEAAPYLVGERDEFEIRVDLDGRVEMALEEVKLLMREAEAGSALFKALVEPEMERAAASVPFDLDVSTERLTESARRVVGPDWMQEQTDAALDEVAPYLVGERDTFEIRVDFGGRTEMALKEVKLLLREADAYVVLYENVIEPQVAEALGETVALGFGIEVTDDEVFGALRRVAPPGWVQEQAEKVLDEAGLYLAGRAERFAVEISLEDNKLEAAAALGEIVGRRFDEAFAALPRCTGAQSPLRLASLELPKCIPEGTQEATISAMRANVLWGIQLTTLGPVPDRIPFTDGHLRAVMEAAGATGQAVSIENLRAILRDGWAYTQDDLRRDLALSRDVDGVDPVALLDDGRTVLRDGWTYTQDDLRRDLALSRDFDGVDPVALLDDGRTVLKDGWSYTQDDLRRDLGREADAVGVDTAGLLDDVRVSLRDGWSYTETDLREWVVDAGGAQALDDLDRARGLIGTGRGYLPLGWGLAALLAVAVGFLGGRGWAGRAAWGSGALLAAAGIVFVAFGPAYHLAGKSGAVLRAAQVESLEEARGRTLAEIERDVADFPRTARLAALKGFDVAESGVDAFVSRVASTARNLAIAALVALAAVGVQARRRALLRRLSEL